MNKNYLYLLIIAGLIGVLGYQIWNLSTRGNGSSASTSTNEVVMYKNPGCQCCTGWAKHMERAGFSVTEKPTDKLAAIKSEQGIPYTMGSCHTAIVNGYVVEGHVPIEDVQRLLKEQPDAKGIAVPGMPAGSPGMESPDPEPYKVFLIGNDGTQSVYAEHN